MKNSNQTDSNYLYEDTPEIEVENAKVPLFTIVIDVILVVICILYLFLHFKAPW